MIGSSNAIRHGGAALSAYRGLPVYAVGEKTAAAAQEGYRDGWYYPGELAALDAANYLYLKGRASDVIIRGGENVPVVEVEGLLYRHPAIQEVAVVAMPDPRLGERACAFAVLREGASLTMQDMVAFLGEQKLARNYLPERLEVVPAMPKTPSGKIQKVVLRGIAKDFTPPQ